MLSYKRLVALSLGICAALAAFGSAYADDSLRIRRAPAYGNSYAPNDGSMSPHVPYGGGSSVIDAGQAQQFATFPSAQFRGTPRPVSSAAETLPWENGAAPTITVRLPEAQKRTGSNLSPAELSILRGREIAVIIDRSGSMSTRDCPASGSGLLALALSDFTGMSADRISRWDWCKRQVADLGRQSSLVSQQGVTLVLFASDAQMYKNVAFGQIPQVFDSNQPGGGTSANKAFKKLMNDYFERKSRGPVPPLAVVFVTDGDPSDADSLKRSIVDATRSVERPDQLSIAFLQIGNARRGSSLLNELDHRLVYYGAAYDAVTSRSFDQVLNTGLTRALVQSVQQSAFRR